MIEKPKAFSLGEIVKLKIDPEKSFIITGVLVRPSSIEYELSDTNNKSFHLPIEFEKVDYNGK